MRKQFLLILVILIISVCSLVFSNTKAFAKAASEASSESEKQPETESLKWESDESVPDNENILEDAGKNDYNKPDVRARPDSSDEKHKKNHKSKKKKKEEIVPIVGQPATVMNSKKISEEEKMVKQQEKALAQTKKKIKKTKLQLKSPVVPDVKETGLLSSLEVPELSDILDLALNIDELSESARQIKNTQIEYEQYVASRERERNLRTSHLEEKLKKLESKKQTLKLDLLSEEEKLERLQKGVTFASADITISSNISKEELKVILSGTNLEQFAGTFVKAEKKYGINAIALCSLSALESDWGTSRRALQDNNYTGFGVYMDSSAGINASSGEENLMATAKWLSKNYLTEEGAYYHGLGLDGVNISYSASPNWAHSIEKIGLDLMDYYRDIVEQE